MTIHCSTTDVVLITGSRQRDRSVMIVVVLGAVACLVCWWKSALLSRQIEECLSDISVSDDDISVQC